MSASCSPTRPVRTTTEANRLRVATDSSAILGIGDQGHGGLAICIGKLALYTLGAGIHPAYTLPISLDVGTDNEALLSDPLYVGERHPRIRGKEYDDFMEQVLSAFERRWPGVLIQRGEARWGRSAWKPAGR